jgi:hypothetical protein
MAEFRTPGCAWNDTIMTPELLVSETVSRLIQPGDVIICGLAECALGPTVVEKNNPSSSFPGIRDTYLSTEFEADAECPRLAAMRQQFSEHSDTSHQ